MWNNYQPGRSGIRFFPHIIPIGFPLIFPLGVGLAFWLFRLVFPILVLLFIAAVVYFIYRSITLGSVDAGWNSVKGTGMQWQQRFMSQAGRPQQPYYQPQQPQQPQQTYYQPQQPQQPQQPYYQPSATAGQSQPEEQVYYRPGQQSENAAPYQGYSPEQTPPMQQQ